MEKTEEKAALKQEKLFTLEQWKTWPEDERWELIGGVAYNMSPAPRVPHQSYAGELFFELKQFLRPNPCLPFIAPVDVFLPDGIENSTETVVQPDVFVVCDSTKVHNNGIHGAPDFIAEVLSESTAYKDWNHKKALYERSGVKEYWLISTETGSVFRYELKDGAYGSVQEVLQGHKIQSSTIPQFTWIAPSPEPSVTS
ncbi:Uma2 family endonuclease [Treponema sp.]